MLAWCLLAAAAAPPADSSRLSGAFRPQMKIEDKSSISGLKFITNGSDGCREVPRQESRRSGEETRLLDASFPESTAALRRNLRQRFQWHPDLNLMNSGGHLRLFACLR